MLHQAKMDYDAGARKNDPTTPPPASASNHAHVSSYPIISFAGVNNSIGGAGQKIVKKIQVVLKKDDK